MTDRRSAPMSEHAPADLLGPLNEVEAKHAPNLLYLLGDATLLQQGRRVSVVGSRRASDLGLAQATAIAEALVHAGVTVVSGLARGIDTAAHQAAIRAGGRTIGVLGTGFDQAYPPQNRPLQRTIALEHLLVTQFPMGYPTKVDNWPRRNRTMALVTEATIIVEAGEKSGTVHQGWEALRLGRPLFLLDALADNPTLSWPSELIGYGAQVLRVEDVAVALEEVPERLHGEPFAL